MKGTSFKDILPLSLTHSEFLWKGEFGGDMKWDTILYLVDTLI